MNWVAIGIIVTVALVVLKISFQAGRIEQGVKGLYRRVDSLETWRNTNPTQQRGVR